MHIMFYFWNISPFFLSYVCHWCVHSGHRAVNSQLLHGSSVFITALKLLLTFTHTHSPPRVPKPTVCLSCWTSLEESNKAECDLRLTQPWYEGVEKQTDDGQRERHGGYGGSQGSLLLPDFHHDPSPASYRGPGHGFGPQTVSGDAALLRCSVFLSHLSFRLFSLRLLCVSLWSQQLASTVATEPNVDVEKVAEISGMSENNLWWINLTCRRSEILWINLLLLRQVCCDEFGLPVEKLFLFLRNQQRIPKDSLNFLNSNKKQANKQISSAWSVSLFKTPSPRASSEVSSVFHVFQGPNGLFSNAPSSPSKESRASSALYCHLMSLYCPFGSSPVWSTHTSPHQEHTAKTPDVHLLLPPSLPPCLTHTLLLLLILSLLLKEQCTNLPLRL